MLKQNLNDDGVLIRDHFVEHSRFVLDCDPAEKMTRDEFANECDINVLMANYERTGQLPPLADGSPQYLDVTDVPDLQRALDVIGKAEEAFMLLPARVRAEFDHNAVAFVEFAEKPENLSRMREWGLAPPAAAKPDPVAPDPVPAGGDQAQ